MADNCAKPCKTLREKLPCDGVFCIDTGGVKVYDNEHNEKQKKVPDGEENVENFYASACCQLAKVKNKPNVNYKYTTIDIKVKFWPSLLSPNVLSCDNKKTDKCKLANLKGYELEIGGSPDPQDPDDPDSVLKQGCPKVIGDNEVTVTNKDGEQVNRNSSDKGLSDRNKKDSFRFPMTIDLSSIIAAQEAAENKRKEENKPVDQFSVCEPLTYQLIKIKVPAVKTPEFQQNDVETFTNEKDILANRCRKYFYPNWSNSGPGEPRVGASIIENDGKKTFYINCKDPQSENLCNMLECLDSGLKPDTWPDQEEPESETATTYSNLYVKLLNKDKTSADPDCSEFINDTPIGLTLSSNSTAGNTTIEGVIDIGVPCAGENYADEEHRPKHPNPKIDGGTGGRVITTPNSDGINTIYIDNRYMSKMCRTEAPDPIEKCEGETAENCVCSSLTPQEYNSWKSSIEASSNQDPKHWDQVYSIPGPKSNRIDEFDKRINNTFCTVHICRTCEQLEKSSLTEFCKKAFDKQRKCWVCDSTGKASDITYEKFCQDKDSLTFLGWYAYPSDPIGTPNTLDYLQAAAKCSPSVVCCYPEPAKYCWYSYTIAPEKTITLNFNLSDINFLKIPLKPQGMSTDTVTFDLHYFENRKQGEVLRDIADKAKISDSLSKIESFSISIDKIPGCSCDKDNKFSTTIFDTIKAQIKNSLTEAYAQYFDICKDVMRVILTSNHGALNATKYTLQSAKENHLLDDSGEKGGLMSGVSTALLNKLKEYTANGTKKDSINTLLDTYFVIDNNKLSDYIDTLLDGNNTTPALLQLEELDCKGSKSITIEGAYTIKITTTEPKCEGSDGTGKVKYQKGSKTYMFNTTTGETDKTNVITEANCTAYVQWAKENKNCCIKNHVYAETAILNENDGSLTGQNSTTGCKVIEPKLDSSGKMIPAAKICTDNVVKYNNKKYRCKVLRICDDFVTGMQNGKLVVTNPCVCTEELSSTCSEYDPEGVGDPVIDDNQDLDVKEDDHPDKEKEEKNVPCSKVTISIESNGTMTSKSQNINFPIKTSILDSNGQEISIEANSMEELDSILNGRDLGQLSSGLSQAEYRTRILSKVFDINVNNDTVINTSKSIPCDEKDTDKKVKDPDDPKDGPPTPQECAKFKSSIQNGQILLNTIESNVKKTEKEIEAINISTKIPEDKKPTMIRNRKQKIEDLNKQKTETQEKIKKIEDNLKNCTEQNS